MAISNALQAAVAGLNSNADAVGSISENIANSGTVGYKRKFSSMVTTTGGNSGGSGVRAVNRQDVRMEGQFIGATSKDDLSIAGEGFFVVSKSPNEPDASAYMLTRAGSFAPDEEGYLRNAAGFYLAGYPYQDDGTLGAVDYTNFSSMRSVRADDVLPAAAPTTTATMDGNLPAGETGTGTAAASFVSTMRYYNALGGSETLSFSWQPDIATANQWQSTITGGDGTVYGTVDVVFSDSGPTPGAPLSYVGTPDAGLTAPAAFSVSATGDISITIDNGTVSQTMTVGLGAPGTYDGTTQFAGDYSPQQFDIDGSSVAKIEDTEFDNGGVLWGLFDNGRREALFQLPIAMIKNPDGLTQLDGTAYKLSRESGDMILSKAGKNGTGTVTPFSLEASNVDVANEMTQLIQIQRAYSSNARVVTTADEMLQETTNLKR
jgi:flagellar hook protein FlgE